MNERLVELIHGSRPLIADAERVLDSGELRFQLSEADDGWSILVPAGLERSARELLDLALTEETRQRTAKIVSGAIPLWTAEGQLIADTAVLVRSRFPDEGRTTWWDGYRIELFKSGAYVTDLANGYETLERALADAEADLGIRPTEWKDV